MLPQKIYSIGIHNHRTPAMLQHCFQNRKRPLGAAKAAADEHCVHLRQPPQKVRYSLSAEHPVQVRQRKHHRLIEFYRFNGINGLRHPQIHQSRPAAQGAHGCKIGGPREAPASAKQQDLPKISLVGFCIPVRQKSPHPRRIQLIEHIHTSDFPRSPSGQAAMGISNISRQESSVKNRTFEIFPGENRKSPCIFSVNMLIFQMICEKLRLGCLVLVCGTSESGMVGAACVQYRAFSHELPSEFPVGRAG